jgi:hypothetical protein
METLTLCINARLALNRYHESGDNEDLERLERVLFELENELTLDHAEETNG